LVDHYLKQHPVFKQKKFSAKAMAALCRYSWPGNVRELQNVVHRILLLTTHDVIEECDLPADLVECKKEKDSMTRLADIERRHILSVLKEAGGHRSKAADALGIDPKTLYRKLLEYGVQE
ncbi:MAG TPA: helix-turn-helix domain-containing protein, partial [Nitrospirota bacterium]